MGVRVDSRLFLPACLALATGLFCAIGEPVGFAAMTMSDPASKPDHPRLL